MAKKRKAKSKKPTKIGRPTKLTPVLARAFCKLIEAEWFVEHAAAEVGVSAKVVREWLEAAEQDGASDLHTDFRSLFERARAKAERKVWDRIRAKSEGNPRTYNPADWKADMEWLKISNPKLYREAKTLEVTGKDGGGLKVEGLAELLALGHDREG